MQNQKIQREIWRAKKITEETPEEVGMKISLLVFKYKDIFSQSSYFSISQPRVWMNELYNLLLTPETRGSSPGCIHRQLLVFRLFCADS